MMGSADMIRFIMRDEVTHLHLFAAIHHGLVKENPEIYDESFYKDAVELFKSAVELETGWGQYIIKGGVLGLTDKIMEDYIKYLANDRAALLGMPPFTPELNTRAHGWRTSPRSTRMNRTSLRARTKATRWVALLVGKPLPNNVSKTLL